MRIGLYLFNYAFVQMLGITDEAHSFTSHSLISSTTSSLAAHITGMKNNKYVNAEIFNGRID